MSSRRLLLFLCGDVAIGRGIDQILPFPGNTRLHESAIKDARRYVELAEQASGTIPRHVDFSYVWGEALFELDRRLPDVRIVNLETAVTTSEDAQAKEVLYRMHPDNVPVLVAAGIDCCSLANNHVLDWGRNGLDETLATLHAAGVKTAGAGRNAAEARAPAICPLAGGGRILVYGFASPTSGVPPSWQATETSPGIQLVDEFVPSTVHEIATRFAADRRRGDIVVASIHWGPNWGYDVPVERRRVAHDLIEAGADIVHGHSSHHVLGVEVYRGRLVLYGAGDFLNDYEGIGDAGPYRHDLGLMYFADVDRATGLLWQLTMVPTRIRRFRLERAPSHEVRWLAEILADESARLATKLTTDAQGNLVVHAL